MTATLPVVKEVLTSPDFRTGIFEPSEGFLGRIAAWAEDPGQLGPLLPPSLLVSEPPDHTRYRKLVTRVFTARAVENLRGRTQQIADELLDSLDPTSPVDLVAAYCSQLPVTVIAEILGVPPEDRAGCWSSATRRHRASTWAWASASSAGWSVGCGSSSRGSMPTSRRLRRESGDDLMSQLVRVQEEGVGLDDAELKATAGLVLAAGFETTVNLLGNGIALLKQHPEQLQRLREDPVAVAQRSRRDPAGGPAGPAHRPPLPGGHRRRRDAGPEAARSSPPCSPAPTATPTSSRTRGTFDVGRANARDHVSFSAGRHYCLGAALARMEGEVGLRTLLERFPDLALEPGADPAADAHPARLRAAPGTARPVRGAGGVIGRGGQRRRVRGAGHRGPRRDPSRAREPDRQRRRARRAGAATRGPRPARGCTTECR